MFRMKVDLSHDDVVLATAPVPADGLSHPLLNRLVEVTILAPEAGRAGLDLVFYAEHLVRIVEALRRQAEYMIDLRKELEENNNRPPPSWGGQPPAYPIELIPWSPDEP